MAIFCRKKLEESLHVGERLKKAREDRQLNLHDVSIKTHVPVKYLEAIESSQFDCLPSAKAHRLAYIREYAQSLDLSPASFLYQFSKESDLENYVPVHPHRSFKIRKLSISSIIKNATVCILIISFLGYLAWQINGILRPPKLTLFTPNDGSVISQMITNVQGETEKEVQLTVNGKDIMPNYKGQFEAQVGLSSGLNTITVSAIKKHGKTTTITRHIIVKPSVTLAQ